MSAKLSASNPYLRDPKQRQRSVLESVATSSAIEGIHAPFKQASPARKPAQKKSDGMPVVKAKSA